MKCFFVNENQIYGDKIEIIGKDVNHIKNVLRCKIEELLEIGIKENSKSKYIVSILEINEEKIICKIKEKVELDKEAQVHINIIQALPKSDKMELIIQKCTELGVKEITPLETARCVVKLGGKDKEKKIQRWQNIAEVAAKQCGRNYITRINNVSSLKNIQEIIEDYDLVLVAYENENNNSLKEILKKSNVSRIAIVIGPEGGFEEKEVQNLINIGVTSVSLGKRILRTETVSIVMASIVLYELGDLGTV